MNTLPYATPQPRRRRPRYERWVLLACVLVGYTAVAALGLQQYRHAREREVAARATRHPSLDALIAAAVADGDRVRAGTGHALPASQPSTQPTTMPSDRREE